MRGGFYNEVVRALSSRGVRAPKGHFGSRARWPMGWARGLGPLAHAPGPGALGGSLWAQRLGRWGLGRVTRKSEDLGVSRALCLASLLVAGPAHRPFPARQFRPRKLKHSHVMGVLGESM